MCKGIAGILAPRNPVRRIQRRIHQPAGIRCTQDNCRLALNLGTAYHKGLGTFRQRGIQYLQRARGYCLLASQSCKDQKVRLRRFDLHKSPYRKTLAQQRLFKAAKAVLNRSIKRRICDNSDSVAGSHWARTQEQ
jgi:hypothetical protein